MIIKLIFSCTALVTKIAKLSTHNVIKSRLKASQSQGWANDRQAYI